jgi:hypothetical protein
MALPDDVQNYVMANGRAASVNVLDLLTKLSELHLIHGLLAGSPLTVTQDQRTAGSIVQTISGSDVDTTVNRTA